MFDAFTLTCTTYDNPDPWQSCPGDGESLGVEDVGLSHKRDALKNPVLAKIMTTAAERTLPEF